MALVCSWLVHTHNARHTAEYIQKQRIQNKTEEKKMHVYKTSKVKERANILQVSIHGMYVFVFFRSIFFFNITLRKEQNNKIKRISNVP